ncbi:hypothetical protein EJB05_22160, partial [Eragrostis curvula]
MQGFGILFGAVVALTVSAGFGSSYPTPSYEANPAASLVTEAADYVWRVILMFGTVPAALIARDEKRAAADVSKVLNTTVIVEDDAGAPTSSRGGNEWGLFSKQFARRYDLHLLATASTLFEAVDGVDVEEQQMSM